MRILTVDDDPPFRRSLCRALSDLGFETVEAGDGVDGEQKLLGTAFDLVITDLNMPRADGFAMIRAVHRHAPKTPVVMLTAATTVDCAAAMRAGATDFMMKPYSPVELERVIRAAIASAAPPAQRVTNRPQAALVGRSRELDGLLQRIESFARGGAPAILLEAERGSGAEAFARLLHGMSSRAGHPFVALAGSICDDDALLMAAEQADRGTLFVDGVSVLGTASQATLAKIIGRGAVRVIASTESALLPLVEDASFHEPLLQLLSEARLTIPPLRERPEDVPPLIQHFLDDANRRHGVSVQLAGATIGALQAYRFPGNVGELESMVDVLVRRGTTKRADAFGEESEPEVSVEEVDVSLLLHDGSRRNVSLIVPAGQTMESLLLTPEPFLLVQDEGRTRHYARATLAMVEVETAPRSIDSLPRNDCRVQVRLLSGVSIEGHMRWVPGVARHSASDVLCEPSSVLVVHAGAITCFIAKSHIAWVEEAS